MDFSFMIAALINVAWYLIPLLTLSFVIKSAWFKGVMGEWQVNLLIGWFLDKKT